MNIACTPCPTLGLELESGRDTTRLWSSAYMPDGSSERGGLVALVALNKHAAMAIHLLPALAGQNPGCAGGPELQGAQPKMRGSSPSPWATWRAARRPRTNRGGVPYAISNPPGSTGWRGTPGNNRDRLPTWRNFAGTTWCTLTCTARCARVQRIVLDDERARAARGADRALRRQGDGDHGLRILDQVSAPGPAGPTRDDRPDLGGFACWPAAAAAATPIASVPIYHAHNHHYQWIGATTPPRREAAQCARRRCSRRST